MPVTPPPEGPNNTLEIPSFAFKDKVHFFIYGELFDFYFNELVVLYNETAKNSDGSQIILMNRKVAQG